MGEQEEIAKIMKDYGNISYESAKELYEQRKEKGVKVHGIKIDVDTEHIEDMSRRLKESESDAKGFRHIAEKLAKACQSEGLEVDSSEITSENYLDYVERLNTQREFNNVRSEQIESKGAGGQATLDMARGKGSNREFSSHEELVDFLRRQERDSPYESERAQASQILAELTRKTLLGTKETDKRINYEFKGEINPITGKEEGIIEKERRKFREKKEKEAREREL